jgi:hypothetical protein
VARASKERKRTRRKSQTTTRGAEMKTIQIFGLSISLIFPVLFSSCCKGVPDNFVDLPLEEKIVEYSEAVKRCGRGSEPSRYEIAIHGPEAVRYVIPSLRGTEDVLPVLECVLIIRNVRALGYDLKETGAKEAIEHFLQNDDGYSHARVEAISLLVVIEKDDQE